MQPLSRAAVIAHGKDSESPLEATEPAQACRQGVEASQPDQKGLGQGQREAGRATVSEPRRQHARGQVGKEKDDEKIRP